MSVPISALLLPAINHIISQASQQIHGLVGFPVDLRIIVKSDEVNEHFLQSIICDYFRVEWYTIQSKSRKKTIVTARQMYCYLCKLYLSQKKSFREIGNEVGGKDHSTVMHSIQIIKDHLDTADPLITDAVKALINVVKEHQAKALDKSITFNNTAA
jgi:hypothetical protein